MKSRIAQSADNNTAATLGAIAIESEAVARNNLGEFTWLPMQLLLTVDGKDILFKTQSKIKLQSERGTGMVKVYIPKIWSVEVTDPKFKKYILCYTMGMLTLLGLQSPLRLEY